MTTIAKTASWMVRHLVYPVWTARAHPHFYRHLREYEATQFLPYSQIRDLQLKRLKTLLEHAFARCPYYREKMMQAGLVPHEVSFETFARLPLLTKKDIQESRRGLEAEGFPREDRLENQTGGSTGAPLQFLVDKERFTSRLASTVRHNRWAGYNVGDWCALLWGAGIDVRPAVRIRERLEKTLLARMIELNTSSFTDRELHLFIDEIRRRRPMIMLGYADSCRYFAQYVRDNRVSGIEFDSVITTAEMLSESTRQLLSDVFHATVFNRYGCREVSVIASECEWHSMHQNAETLLVEIVPDTGSLDAAAGKIVVTDLLNQSMPLIRYEIGDMGSLSDKSCPCGRGLPLLANLAGRTTDFVTLASGRRVSGPALTLVIKDLQQVAQAQFIQESAESVTLRIVPGRGYGAETEEELRRRLRACFGPEAAVHVVRTDLIAKEPSGKSRFVIARTNPSADASTRIDHPPSSIAEGS